MSTQSDNSGARDDDSRSLESTADHGRHDRPAAADHAGRAAVNPSRRLQVRGLACRRGERVLFANLDLDVDVGELVWLRAANGFGKTTLLRVLAGLAKPEAGTVAWDGGDEPPAVLYLAHATALKDDLTVVESVRHDVALHGLVASDTGMADAIRRCGLHGRRHAPIRTLSQGQRRRVALTRLVLSQPRTTWLLDEPYDALDADGVDLVGTLLAEHAERGGNALFTSHVAPVVAGATPRIVQLEAAASAALAA